MMIRKYLLICCFVLFMPSLITAKIVFKSTRDGGSNLYVMDDDGSNVQRLTFPQRPHWDSFPRWSPDGTRIMFMRNISNHPRQQTEIFIMDSDGNHEKQITHNPALDEEASWAPDGQHITFTNDRSGSLEIYVMDILTRKVQQITHNPGLRESASHPSWSPNGKYIAYRQVLPPGLQRSM